MAIHTYNVSLNSAKCWRAIFFPLFIMVMVFFIYLFISLFCLFVLFCYCFFLSFQYEEKFHFSIFCSFSFLKMTCDSVFELFLCVILCEYRILKCRQILTYKRVWRCGLCFQQYL